MAAGKREVCTSVSCLRPPMDYTLDTNLIGVDMIVMHCRVAICGRR